MTSAALMIWLQGDDVPGLVRAILEDLGEPVETSAVMLDPPYQGKTGYPAECSRAEVLRIAEVWARHGGRVLVCEAEGLAAELGGGWVQEQLAGGEKPEWVTCYNCDMGALRPALFRHFPHNTEPLPLLGTSGGGGEVRPTPEDHGP